MDTGPQSAEGLWLGRAAVLVPVKAFAYAKLRLAEVLSREDREALVKDMAARVVRAAVPLPVAVVCDDRGVAGWARELGALVVWEPGQGLNGAVEAGVSTLARCGAQRVVVAHADLPLATGLAGLAGGDGIVLVPDRRRDGTNVIVVPVGAGFRFAYGPGSFARHLAEVQRLGLEARVVEDPGLSFDVDVPSDLLHLTSSGPT